MLSMFLNKCNCGKMGTNLWSLINFIFFFLPAQLDRAKIIFSFKDDSKLPDKARKMKSVILGHIKTSR